MSTLRSLITAALLLPLSISAQEIVGIVQTPTAPSIVPVLVRDINMGRTSTGSDITNLCASNGRVYFSADDSTTSDRLWVSNGTTAGTVPLMNYGNQPPYDAIIPFGLRTIFRTAEVAGGGLIYTTTGTTSQALNATNYAPNFSNATVMNGKLYFPSGRDVLMAWTVTLNGAVNPAAAFPTNVGKMPKPLSSISTTFGPLVGLNGKLIFSYASADHGAELFVTTGVAPLAQTPLKDLVSGKPGSDPTNLVVFNGKVYFAAGVKTTANIELCSTDGTAAGTALVKEINSSLTVGSSPTDLTVFNGKLYFTANDGTGRGLWMTDGTAAGTVKVNMGVIPDPQPGNLVVASGKLYFTASNGADARAIWTTDGGGSATIPSWSPFFGATSLLTACNNKLVCMAQPISPFIVRHLPLPLFVVDVNAAAPLPAMVHTPAPAQLPTKGPITLAFDPDPELAILGNTVFFRAKYTEAGHELWKFDL